MANRGSQTRVGAVWVGLCLAVAATSTQAAKDSEFPSWSRYTDGDGHFSIQFPESWQRKVIVGSESGVWFAGNLGGCRVRLQADPGAAGMSSDEALREFGAHALEEQVAMVYEDAKLLSSTTILLSGVPAQLFEIEHSTGIPGQKARTREISAWLFRSGVSYLLSCSSPVATYAQAESDFRVVIGSFELPALVLPEALQVAPEVRPKANLPLPSPSAGAVGSANRAFFLAIYPLLAVLHAWLARRRHRNPWPWALLGPFFFPIALVVLARKRPPTDAA